jgi:hypothetical protein
VRKGGAAQTSNLLHGDLQASLLPTTIFLLLLTLTRNPLAKMAGPAAQAAKNKARQIFMKNWFVSTPHIYPLDLTLH